MLYHRNAIHRSTGHGRTAQGIRAPGSLRCLGSFRGLPGMVSLRDETMTPAVQPIAVGGEPKSWLNLFRSAPNLLTLMRICLAPFLVAAILEGHFKLSFALFVAAGLTDALDGTLARMLKQRSTFGAISRSGGRQAAAEHAVSGAVAQGADAGHRDGAGLRQGCGHPAGFGPSLRGRGPSGVSSQHLRQGQHPCPDQRGSGCSAASAHRRLLGSYLRKRWPSMPPWRLPSSRGCITRGWFRAAPAHRPPMAPPRNNSMA